MTLDLVLFAVALLLVVAAAIVGRERPAARDPERLFKVVLATLLQARVEAEGGGAEAWERAVRRLVPFHPAGREGWRKVQDPVACRIPVPAVPGELALMEGLRRAPTPRERVRWMLREDAAGLDALAADPSSLGRDGDPATWVGPGIGWEDLARWNQPVKDALVRRLAHVRIVVLHGSEDAARAEALRVDWASSGRTTDRCLGVDSLAEEAAQALVGQLLESAPERADRLALLALGHAGPALLQALATSETLRDRTLVVGFLGCPLGGVAGEAPPGLDRESRTAWNEANFRHEVLDTEVRRETPYLFVPLLDVSADVPGDGRAAWADQRLDAPPVPPSGRCPVRPVDLGPLWTGEDAIPDDVLARGLLLVLLAMT